MSNINFTCPHCSFSKQLPASAEGMQGNCPSCKAVITIRADAPENPSISPQQSPSAPQQPALQQLFNESKAKASTSIRKKKLVTLVIVAACVVVVLITGVVMKVILDAKAAETAIANLDWETALELDPDNSVGLRLAAAEKAQILAGEPITNTIDMTFNNIPAGTFLMGSPVTIRVQSNEILHKVTITKPFYMQTTEVTQGQWKAVMGTEPWVGQVYVHTIEYGTDYPASHVSRDDAIAYCKKLSEKEGKTYRLPTEAEWEYACRAGTKTSWSFGNDPWDEKVLGDYAWYSQNASGIPHQVGLKKPNAFGLYDMHGNVDEWCHDHYEQDYYKQSPEKDPTGPAFDLHYVTRGGNCCDHLDTRSACRSGSLPTDLVAGFRLVRELDDPAGLRLKAADDSAGLRLKAAVVTAALSKGYWKVVLALDATNSEGLRMQAAAEKAAAEKVAAEQKAAAAKAAAKAAAEKAAILAGEPITNTIGMTFNNIPAGTFMMGSPEDEPKGLRSRGGETLHKVTITKTFYMQTTEVTQGQWMAVMGMPSFAIPQYTSVGSTSRGRTKGPNYPVSFVSWDDAVAYCKKLSVKEGKTYRLPTEAEWEYACRAGTKTAWSFGKYPDVFLGNDDDVFGDYAWYLLGDAQQVGLKKPNAFGLYDMHSNVEEWCHDYYGYDYYKQSPEQDPTGPTSGSSRVVRGGSVDTQGYWDIRSASRWGWDVKIQLHKTQFNGFRIVRELD